MFRGSSTANTKIQMMVFYLQYALPNNKLYINIFPRGKSRSNASIYFISVDSSFFFMFRQKAANKKYTGQNCNFFVVIVQ